ncbi:hypothetical protein Y032_0005g2760 [Ancylostoma ceylanicum]|uniref:Uncharacterized protein n=1 Tax=Ancylostoma ceylanicum TaxID=53326 RepID=A0A016VST3_9BILA|nr:hypothetical protein Y032_0005g2760 [Ancylostoma ceylanicum]
MKRAVRSSIKGRSNSSEEQLTELQVSIKEVNASTQVPKCVKNALNHLLEEVAKLRNENDELRKENSDLREKLRIAESKLSEQSTESVDKNPPSACSASTDFHESERLRSIVISGVPELESPILRDKLQSDFDRVVSILTHLNIGCFPVAVYRLGKQSNRPRLIKCVLPAQTFQRLAVKRAPLLRFFPEKGIFLRESLTDAERKRRRDERTHRSLSNNHPPGTIDMQEN